MRKARIPRVLFAFSPISRGMQFSPEDSICQQCYLIIGGRKEEKEETNLPKRQHPLNPIFVSIRTIVAKMNSMRTRTKINVWSREFCLLFLFQLVAVVWVLASQRSRFVAAGRSNE